ncbi:SusD/RagB family nutrient-binding outer membrane lipoprotein [Chryseobacterium arachidis]|uniref:SusD/RagB family nutrient-binding outer membrane lipoprotein n=1 Tax=Chryseobacterium arachidis TaxID=1416778 RepID=UPI0036167F47
MISKERLAAAETTLYSTQAVTLNRFGNLMMNAWAGNIYQYTAPFDDEMKMNVSSTFYSGIWDNYYIGIANLQSIINTKDASVQYPSHVAAAKILKAYYMQTIVDLYNDAPYSEAFQLQSNVSPKYDKGKDIYKALINEVDEAFVLLAKNATITANQDPMFAGSLAKWGQFGNLVKLKLLVRLSKSTDPEVIAYRNAALATLPNANAAVPTEVVKYIPASLTEDFTIQPGYNSGNATQQNPLYRNYGVLVIGNEINANYRLIFGSANIVDNMMGRVSRTTGLVDSRIARMFQANVWSALEDADVTPGFEGYYGIPQGTNNNPSNTVGDYVGLGQKNFLVLNSAGQLSLSLGSSQAGIVMSNAEAQFLLAEAAVVFPSKFTGAQTFFNNGISSSFLYYGLTATQATTYINNSNLRANVGWNATTDKIAAIQYQRWIALTNINPTETFIGYTKTGYPVTPMPLNASTSTRPLRLIYPQSEYVANSANVPNLVKSDAFSLNQYSPFWLK